ncbi:MAG: guanylate kinase [Legionellales bacterium]|nr:guanylate kinase [Legionellales bacterium]
MDSPAPGQLFIVAAPSGGGKTSLVKNLITHLPQIVVSVSHTTRMPRPGEVNSVDYFFVDETRFMRMVEEGDFVEHASVFGCYYGTSEAQIKDRLQAGIDVVLDIDWQGAQQIKHRFINAVSVFVVPPSLDVLKQRLMDRQQDDAEIIKNRMQSAQNELSHYPEFDYLIINDDFNKAAEDLRAVVIAQRLSIIRQAPQQRQLLSFLLSSL